MAEPSGLKTNQPDGLGHLLSFKRLGDHLHVPNIAYSLSIDEVIAG
jgi:hypothetical protein